VTHEEYATHLEGQLCWHCHCPTHASHARQRQCPRCRQKWSYDRQRLQWRLAELFCQGVNAHRASKELNISYGTARSHFTKFDLSFAQTNHPVAKTLLSIRKENNRVPERWQQPGISLIYSFIMAPSFSIKPVGETSGDYLLVS
jgi:hypothetical protein